MEGTISSRESWVYRSSPLASISSPATRMRTEGTTLRARTCMHLAHKYLLNSAGQPTTAMNAIRESTISRIKEWLLFDWTSNHQINKTLPTHDSWIASRVVTPQYERQLQKTRCLHAFKSLCRRGFQKLKIASLWLRTSRCWPAPCGSTSLFHALNSFAGRVSKN